MGFLDDFYDVLFKPVEGLKRVATKANIWAGLLVYLGVIVIANLSTVRGFSPAQISEMSMGTAISTAFFEAISGAEPLLSLVLVLSFGPLIFLARASFLNLAAHLLGEKGDVRSLGAALGYAQLPTVLIAPFSFLNRIIPLEIMGAVSVFTFIWVFSLRVLALRTTFNLSTGRAVLVIFLPFLFLLAALLFFFLFLGAFLSPLLAEFLTL